MAVKPKQAATVIINAFKARFETEGVVLDDVDYSYLEDGVVAYLSGEETEADAVARFGDVLADNGVRDWGTDAVREALVKALRDNA